MATTTPRRTINDYIRSGELDDYLPVSPTGPRASEIDRAVAEGAPCDYCGSPRIEYMPFRRYERDAAGFRVTGLTSGYMAFAVCRDCGAAVEF